MIGLLRKLFPERSAARLFYHRVSGILAAAWNGFPAKKMIMVGITGTSGKSSTVEILHHILQSSGKKCGALSGVSFHIGHQTYANKTLRTTLRPWMTQRLLKTMVQEGCEICVMEVSSHAIDQNRIIGIPFDTVILSNIYDNEHLDYHENFADYVKTKARLFEEVNTSYRKPNVDKVMVLNRDMETFDIFDQFQADAKWTFSIRKQSTFRPDHIKYLHDGIEFELRVPNNHLHMKVPMVGRHNIENIMAAIAGAQAHGVSYPKIQKSLEHFHGIPGRLESISGGQPFSVLVDFSYKPSALNAVLSTLSDICKGKLIVIWGGAGGREESNWEECADAIKEWADEFILTTDDPYDVDPKHIAQVVRNRIQREEGDRFYEIEDRYEAIRYALFTAEVGDVVLVAGRGHEQTQTIGKTKIPFDDREVCREILAIANEKQPHKW